MESIDTRGNLCQTTQHLTKTIGNNSLGMLMVIEQAPITQPPLIFLHRLSSFCHNQTQCHTLPMITWIQTEPTETWLHYANNQQQFNQLMNLYKYKE